MTVPFLPDEIEALTRLGMFGAAVDFVDILERRGKALGDAWALATASRSRGLLLAAQGDLEGATGAVGQALAYNQALGMPLELGRTLLVEGQIRRRGRRWRAARTSLASALSIFQECGAELWAQQARDEIGRLGTRRAPGELTVTEEKVASLAASGMINRDIASALFISPKTVEDNLSRVYRKLNLHTRAELGAAMAKRDPAPGASSAAPRLPQSNELDGGTDTDTQGRREPHPDRIG
jgi:DNA-binding CsgD family transcriptional regulator